jgi:hypothetical protein
MQAMEERSSRSPNSQIAHAEGFPVIRKHALMRGIGLRSGRPDSNVQPVCANARKAGCRCGDQEGRPILVKPCSIRYDASYLGANAELDFTEKDTWSEGDFSTRLSRRKLSRLAFAFLALVGLTLPACGGSRLEHNTPSVAVRSTRYRTGDYVVYRYSGSFTPSPVTLREEVLEQQDNRLTIEVRVERGTEKRRWLQVLTDTPENEKNNVVDELYLLSEGNERRRLPNVNNADLYRLYEWTVFNPNGKAQDVRISTSHASFGGVTFECDRTEGRNTWQERPLRFETNDCKQFLWTHGPGRFWDEMSGQDIIRIEILEFGNSIRSQPGR